MRNLLLVILAVFSLNLISTAQETEKLDSVEKVQNQQYENNSSKKDSTLVLDGKDTITNLKQADNSNSAVANNDIKPTIVPSQGFSINSLWRGALGMLVLIFIAFLFSNNRKAVNWKTVGIGLSLSLIHI